MIWKEPFMKTSSEVWSFKHLVHLINQVDWAIETIYIFINTTLYLLSLQSSFTQ